MKGLIIALDCQHAVLQGNELCSTIHIVLMLLIKSCSYHIPSVACISEREEEKFRFLYSFTHTVTTEETN